MKVSVVKPGSPDEILEFLEHHGVKGQKWGVRQSRQATRKFVLKNPTARNRSDAIRRARANQLKRKTDFKTERNKAKRADLKKAFLTNPDRVTAARLTRGEKVVLGLMIAIPNPGTPSAIGAVGGLAIARRRAERRIAQK